MSPPSNEIIKILEKIANLYGVEKNEDDCLTKLVEIGLQERYETISKKINSMAEYEINAILENGVTDMLLTAWDIVSYAKKQNIPVGIGRNNMCSCLVNYALGITDIDPIKHKLLFERFIDSKKSSLLFAFLEFGHKGRQKVLEYIRENYGEDAIIDNKYFTHKSRGKDIMIEIMFTETATKLKETHDLIEEVWETNLVLDNDVYKIVHIYKYIYEEMKDDIVYDYIDMLKKIKPTNFEELMAGMVLFDRKNIRLINKYINARKSKEINYIIPSLKKFLDSTYGIILYEEQVMEILSYYMKCEMKRISLLRKEIFVKNRIDCVEKNIITSFIENGLDEKTAKTLLEMIKESRQYAVNKAYYVAKATIIYRTAFYKRRFTDCAYGDAIENGATNITGDELQLHNLSNYCYKISNGVYKILVVRKKCDIDCYLKKDCYNAILVLHNDKNILKLIAEKNIDVFLPRQLYDELKRKSPDISCCMKAYENNNYFTFKKNYYSIGITVYWDEKDANAKIVCYQSNGKTIVYADKECGKFTEKIVYSLPQTIDIFYTNDDEVRSPIERNVKNHIKDLIKANKRRQIFIISKAIDTSLLINLYKIALREGRKLYLDRTKKQLLEVYEKDNKTKLPKAIELYLPDMLENEKEQVILLQNNMNKFLSIFQRNLTDYGLDRLEESILISLEFKGTLPQTNTERFKNRAKGYGIKVYQIKVDYKSANQNIEKLIKALQPYMVIRDKDNTNFVQ
ncbi:MAG: hypothetical protein ACOCP4_06115 [Candidatus Woesearchaeota archaeon]